MMFAGGIPASSAAGQSQKLASLSHSSVSTRALQIRNVAVERTTDGVAVAITSNGALVPTITKLDGPPRLVIDLAGAVSAVPRSRAKPSGEIKSIRVSQYQEKPPLTRIVVDLAEPRDYGWETVPNKLVVHLRTHENSGEEASQPAIAGPAFTTGSDSATADSPAAVVFAANTPSASSTVNATQDTVVVNLGRGGQIRVCPGTNVSLTSAQNGHDVMVGMNTGALETHYSLPASSDSILTPDFRILLAGPGQFDLAVSADSHGDTCVRGLPGNRSGAVVSELMGDGVYEVKADEQVVFRSGQIKKVDHDVPIDCGCPPVESPVLRAEAPSNRPVQADNEIAAAGMPAEGSLSVGNPELTKPAPTRAHVQFDAPLVFRGDTPLPAATEEAAKLPVVTVTPGPLAIIPLPPPGIAESGTNNPPPKPRTGFLGHVKRFFSAVFG